MEEKNLEIQGQNQEIPEETEEKQFEAAGQESLPVSAADASASNWRQSRDAGALAREALNKEEDAEALHEEAPEIRLSRREQRRQEREEARRRRDEEKQDKKDRRTQARQERHKEVRFLWRTVEFVMLVTFVALAIDQAGLYGFLFVWLFIAVAATSLVLLLAGVARAVAKKRTGIILLTALIGIIGSIAWFIFLVPSRGIGIGTF